MAGGFRPVQTQGGQSYVGKVQTYAVAASSPELLAVGDLVTLSGTARSSDGMATVVAATAGTGNLILGAIVAIDPDYSDLARSGLPAADAGTVKVNIDPNTLYEATVDGAVEVADVGQNAPIIDTDATTSGGLTNSNHQIDISGTVGTTEQIRIVGLKDGATAAGSTVYCRINEHFFNTVGA